MRTVGSHLDTVLSFNRHQGDEEIEMRLVLEMEDQTKMGLMASEYELPRMTSEEFSVSIAEPRQ